MDVAQARAVLTLDDSQYQRGIKKAAGSFDQMGKQVEGAGKRVSASIGSSLAGIVGGFAIGGAIAAAGRAAINLAADYEQSLNVLGAVSGATAAQMKDLAGLAEQLGSDLSLPATSANDAALAMQELSKAGLSVSDTMAAARGTLQLAAAAGIDAARAAEVQAAALNAFKLSGDQATKVADQLAATANSSAADITDLADAFKYAATAFSESGQSMTSLNTALGLLANAGIKGFTAGTGLRTMLASLTAPTKDATAVLQALGIQVFDNQGRMRQLRDIIDQFSRKLGPVTQQQRQWALQQIFGREAANQANIVLTQGVQKYDQMAKAVTRSGAAADLAAAKNKGLKGAFDGLRSAIETAAVKAVRPFQADLENLVRATARAVEAIGSNFPRGVEQARSEISTSWGAILELFTSGFTGLQESHDAFFNKSKQGWSGYWSTLRGTVSRNLDDIRNQIANIRANRTGLDKFIDQITGKKPLSGAQMQQGNAAANKIWAGMYSERDFQSAEQQAKQRLTRVGEAFPQGIVEGIQKGAGKVNQKLKDLMGQEGTGKAKLTPAQRQELALTQELSSALARLSELRAGEGNIAAQVAGRYNLIKDAREGELVAVLKRIDASQKDAESMRRYREELERVQAATREAKSYGGAQTLRNQYRDVVTDDQIRRLANAKEWLAKLQDDHKKAEEAARRQAEANERLKETIESVRLEGIKYRNESLYGEINRQSLAIDNFRMTWEELNPAQQSAITQLFNYRKAIEITKQATDEFTKSAERRIKAYNEEQELLKREADVMADFQRAMADARREQEKAREDQFTEGLQRLSDEARRRAEEYQQAIESVADGLAGVFENAFLDLNKGFSGFITSIIDGFQRMLQQLAAQYLASQLIKLLARTIGVDIGGAGGSIVGTIFGGGKAIGGPVQAGRGYVVGEQGPEYFMPRTSGTIIPAGAGAGGGTVHVTFNISTPDVGGFQRNQRALMAQAYDEAARQRRRDGS